MDIKKVTDSSNLQKKWAVQAVDKADKTKAENYLNEVRKIIAQLEQNLAVAGAQELKSELELFVSQQSDKLAVNVAQYHLSELKKECANWVKWLDQAVMKKNTNQIQDYSKKFRDALDKRRAAVEVLEAGREFLREMEGHIDKATGNVGNVELTNQAEKLLETARFKMKWVDQYMKEKKIKQCQDMYNELQKAAAPLAEEKFSKLESVVKFNADVALLNNRYLEEIGNLMVNQDLEKDSESIKHLIKWLNNELNNQRRVPQLKDYVEKLQVAYDSFSSKFAKLDKAESLIEEARSLIDVAKAQLDTTIIARESEKILEKAKFKLKWVEQYLDERKTTQCTDTLVELKTIIEPLFDSRFVTLDSVVQFYAEYERVNARYTEEIGQIIAEKEISSRSEKIEHFVKLLRTEIENQGELSKIKSYFNKLQSALDPIQQYAEYPQAQTIIEEANEALEMGARAIENIAASKEVVKIIETGRFKMKWVEQYLSEKQPDKCSGMFESLLKVIQPLSDPKFSTFESVTQFLNDFEALNLRVRNELGAIVMEKEIASKSESLRNYIKMLKVSVDTKASLGSLFSQHSNLVRVFEPFKSKYAEQPSASALIKEAEEVIASAAVIIEEEQKQKALEKQQEAESKKERQALLEQWKQGVTENNLEAARQRMEQERKRISEQKEYYSSLRNAVSVKDTTKSTSRIRSSIPATTVPADTPVRIVIDKDGILPVFDAHLSEDSLYSSLLSINRSTEVACEKFEEWEEYIDECFGSEAMIDEHSVLSRSREFYEKIGDSIKYSLFYADKNQELRGGKEVYEIVLQKGKQAREIIDEKLKIVTKVLPFKNLIKKAQGYISRIRDDNSGKQLMGSIATRLLNQVMPVLQEAMKLMPESREECEEVVQDFIELKKQVEEKQAEIGRTLVMRFVASKSELDLTECLKQLEKTCSTEFMEQIQKDIEKRKLEIAEEERIEAERQRVEAEKQRILAEERRKQCQAEWKDKYTTGGKIQNNDYEVWEYTANGEIRCTSIQTKSDKMDFLWTGTGFRHVNSASPSYMGAGVWDGSLSEWANSEGTIYRYRWSDSDSRYICASSLLQSEMPNDWNWTGTKLISNHDTWEVIEGQVPHPVILGIAMLKLVPAITKALIKHKEQEEARRKEEEARKREELKKQMKKDFRCGSLNPNYVIYMCHNCSLGKKQTCAMCKSGFSKNTAHMCHNCNNHWKQYCFYCRSVLSPSMSWKHEVKVCHNCSLGQERCVIKK